MTFQGVGLIIGFIFGATNIMRFGAGPNGPLRTLGQYMMGSAATFGYDSAKYGEGSRHAAKFDSASSWASVPRSGQNHHPWLPRLGQRHTHRTDPSFSLDTFPGRFKSLFDLREWLLTDAEIWCKITGEVGVWGCFGGCVG